MYHHIAPAASHARLPALWVAPAAFAGHLRALRVPANFFAYPSGRLDAGVVAAVERAGYLAATTTRRGYATPRDRFRLARVQVSRGLTATDLLRRLRALRPR
jgi:hypothetical protein